MFHTYPLAFIINAIEHTTVINNGTTTNPALIFSLLLNITAAIVNPKHNIATVYKGNIIKNLIMDCQSYTKYRPNETTGGIFVSWRRKEELPTGA